MSKNSSEGMASEVKALDSRCSSRSVDATALTPVTEKVCVERRFRDSRGGGVWKEELGCVVLLL